MLCRNTTERVARWKHSKQIREQYPSILSAFEAILLKLASRQKSKENSDPVTFANLFQIVPLLL